MPTTTIEHEPWCSDHITEAGWNTCNSNAIDFGPTDSEGFRDGVWLSQDEHDGKGLMVAGSYGTHSFRVEAEAAHAFLDAAREDSEGLISALMAVLDGVRAGV